MVGGGTDGAVRTANEGSADRQCSGICASKAAAGVGVKGRLIVRVIAHALDDIDLASSRPVGSWGFVSAERNDENGWVTVTPPGWPCPTPSWHVHGIHDEQTAVEGILRVYPNALAITRDLLGGFDLHEDISIRIYTDESVGLLQAAINH